MADRASKRRKTSVEPSNSSQPAPSGKLQSAFFHNAANWNLEQDYTVRHRKSNKRPRENTRLPIKTADGRVQKFEPSLDGDLESDSESADNDEASPSTPSSHLPSSRPASEPSTLPERQQIIQAKEELANIALAVIENPEENLSAFKAMAEIGRSSLESIRKLALATQLAVYKDVIPGYRIRPSEDSAELLSKDARRIRQYEQALVSGYRSYIGELGIAVKTKPSAHAGGQVGSLSSVAIACVCVLITAVPHFNFRTDLIKIAVGKLRTRILSADPDTYRCLNTLQTLFENDEDGRVSLEAVSLLSKMMRARDYHVDPAVLNLFLHLRLLSEFAGKGSQNQVERPQADATGAAPQKKKDRVFRTKKERKAIKEQKTLDRHMARADAVACHEERDITQSDTLKLVFATYFRILKARIPHLMGAVLEGLARYAHLINQDFFGDLLEALKDLIRHADGDDEIDEENSDDDKDPGGDGDSGDINDEKKAHVADTNVAAANVTDNPTTTSTSNFPPSRRNLSREALLCTLTAFSLLAGQDAHNARQQLHLDLSFFITHLYRALLPLATHPGLELTGPTQTPTPPSLTTTPPLKPTSPRPWVNAQTTTVLLVQCLGAVLLPPWNVRSVPPLRVAAFTKQLMTVAMQLPARSCAAVLTLLGDVARQHGRKVAALWNTDETRRDGAFAPLSLAIEASNPFAATVWEGEILRHHFSPRVRDGLALLEKAVASA